MASHAVPREADCTTLDDLCVHAGRITLIEGEIEAGKRYEEKDFKRYHAGSRSARHTVRRVLVWR